MLIVLQLVFSVLFMCFAGAVYSFQQSWKSKAETAQKDVTSLNQKVSQLTEDRKRDVELIDAELKKQKETALVEQGQRKQLEIDLQTARGELAQTEQQRDKHLADLQVSQAEAEARIAEAVNLREETQKLRETLSQQLSDIRAREDRNLELSGLVGEAKIREKGYLNEIGRLQNLLRFKKIDPRESINAPDSEDIEKVEGLVEGTRKDQARSEYVKISIGSDDRVKKGMLMDVYRADKWLCQIRVTDVYPDKAVGLVIESTRNGNIVEGDHVTTKL